MYVHNLTMIILLTTKEVVFLLIDVVLLVLLMALRVEQKQYARRHDQHALLIDALTEIAENQQRKWDAIYSASSPSHDDDTANA